MDGRLLGLARKEKERIRQRAEAENDRRHAEVYARVPAIRALDERIAALMGEAVNAALGGPGRSMDELQRESIDLQAERAERRRQRREENEYDLLPVERATTSLADKFAGFKFDEE